MIEAKKKINECCEELSEKVKTAGLAESTVDKIDRLVKKWRLNFMKTKVILTFLVLIFSLSLLSCYENKKVAIFAFNKGAGVPNEVASLARKIVADTTMKRKKYDVISTSLIDEKIVASDTSTMSDLISNALNLGADILIIGNIEIFESTSNSSKVGEFLESRKGVRYKVEVNCIDTMKNSVIASFTENYYEDLKKMDKKVKKLKLGGRKFTAW